VQECKFLQEDSTKLKHALTMERWIEKANTFLSDKSQTMVFGYALTHYQHVLSIWYCQSLCIPLMLEKRSTVCLDFTTLAFILDKTISAFIHDVNNYFHYLKAFKTIKAPLNSILIVPFFVRLLPGMSISLNWTKQN